MLLHPPPRASTRARGHDRITTPLEYTAGRCGEREWENERASEWVSERQRDGKRERRRVLLCRYCLLFCHRPWIASVSRAAAAAAVQRASTKPTNAGQRARRTHKDPGLLLRRRVRRPRGGGGGVVRPRSATVVRSVTARAGGGGGGEAFLSSSSCRRRRQSVVHALHFSAGSLTSGSRVPLSRTRRRPVGVRAPHRWNALSIPTDFFPRETLFCFSPGGRPPFYPTARFFPRSYACPPWERRRNSDHTPSPPPPTSNASRSFPNGGVRPRRNRETNETAVGPKAALRLGRPPPPPDVPNDTLSFLRPAATRRKQNRFSITGVRGLNERLQQSAKTCSKAVLYLRLYTTTVVYFPIVTVTCSTPHTALVSSLITSILWALPSDFHPLSFHPFLWLGTILRLSVINTNTF